MKISLKNCNNIDTCEVEIKEKLLNIKYAINGTGKSTISKAVTYALEDKLNGTKKLSELMPFKFRGKDGNEPSVDGYQEISTIKVFDENYINDFIFQSNELLKGSFDVFIRGEAYENGMKEIEAKTQKIRAILEVDESIVQLINDLNELSNGFGKSTKTGIHGSSSVAQAFKEGNKVVNIPAGLEGYKPYIQHSENYKWVQWQLNGKGFLGIATECPYCTNDIKGMEHTIELVSQTYKPKNVENLSKLIAVFERLDQYFSDETRETIKTIITNIDGYSEDQEGFLRGVKQQIDDLNTKFKNAQRLGFQSFKDVEKVIEGLKRHLIDLNLYPYLNSSNTSGKVEIVNKTINEVISEAGELQGSINKQKLLIEQLVKENSLEINSFLKNAGYQYVVDLIEDEQGQYQLKLIHIDQSTEIVNAKSHLSYGERNAFALVLFMYHVLKTNPDLIVLDDPISSFDKNKKYAIVDMLFRRKKSLRDKTVLLLTHDFEPVVDMLLHHSDRFSKPYVTFLENDGGRLTEKEVSKDCVKNFYEIHQTNIASEIHDLNKLVYLRRIYEVLGQSSHGYDVLSNLFHKRKELTIKTSRDIERKMTEDEFKKGCSEIAEKIPTFDYYNMLSIISDDSQLKQVYKNTNNNYERLHIFRLIFDDKTQGIESDVIMKFINESFHIENNYIYQLNPTEFQLVPNYVIDECNKCIETLTQ